MRERDELKESHDQLVTRNGELAHALRISGLQVDKLLHDKIMLARELNEARTAMDFLKGRMSYETKSLRAANGG